MSVYNKFEAHDLLYSLVHATPSVTMVSGTVGGEMGWSGNVGVSSSISLYDGIRGRTDVRHEDYATSGISVYPLDPLDTHSIDKVIYVSGSYPSTGSLHFVKVRNEEAANTSDITSVDWYEEHFNPIMSLYEYYSRFNSEYSTSSYDFYCLRFKPRFQNLAPAVNVSSSMLDTVSTEFTYTAYIKPIVITGSQDYTIISTFGRLKIFITGSNGNLAFSDYASVVTSSSPITANVWQEATVVVGNGSASFYINSVSAGEAVYTGSINSFSLTYPDNTYIGAELNSSQGYPANSVNGFNGFMFESRLWDTAKTQVQVANLYDATMINSSSDSSLRSYIRFNDGPTSTKHGYSIGYGAYDYSARASGSYNGELINFSASPYGPVWHPNDHPTFSTTKTLVSYPASILKVVHCPSLFYGRQIATGSVVLTCNEYNADGISRVLKDDGRGSLYISGSITSIRSGEEYAGQKWNKVGNVFYTEGLIVISDPSLMDFGEVNAFSETSTGNILTVKFSGDERISTKVFMCRADATRLNASSNPTFTKFNDLNDEDPSNDIIEIRTPRPVTYITSIGLYNDQRKLVAVAKLASPIRKREKDKILIRLRLDI